MKTDTFVAYVLLILQLLGLAGIAVTGPVFPKNIWLFVIELFGILLAIWAIVIMNPAKVRALPLINDQIDMISKGPYSVIRHPMYLSIFLVVAALLINHFTFLRLMIAFVLLCDLIFKIEFEEKQLIKYYKSYSAYRERTYKLIPFLY